MLLTNNLLLAAAAGTVLLGTLFPLAMDALDLGKISVGPPYFNAVFVPLMVPLVFLMGIGPYARWKKASLPELAIRLRWAFGAGVVSALILPFTMGRWSPMVALGLLMALWVTFSVVGNLWQRVRASGSGLLGQPPSYLGMSLAHLGVAIFIVGVTMVGAYEQEKDVRMEVGDHVTMGSYVFRFDGVVGVQGPNYQSNTGTMRVTKNGKPVTTLYPEKRIYQVQTMPMTEAAIHSTLTRDLYVSLGEPVGGGAWSVRVYYKPFVSWIWGGCTIMALGGLLTLLDPRYRLVLGGLRGRGKRRKNELAKEAG